MPKAEAPVEEQVAAPPAPAPQVDAAHRSMIDVMRDILHSQPKRRIKVRNDSDVFVQINGYSYLIQPNVFVEVPEQVAQMLEDGDYS